MPARLSVREGAVDDDPQHGAGVGGVVAGDAVQDDALAEAIRARAAECGSVAPRRAMTVTIDRSITMWVWDTAARISRCGWPP